MTRVALTEGAYVARSVIAQAQRCVNLYPELNPEKGDSPVPVTLYPTPGLTKVATASPAGMWRGLWLAGNGELFGVCDNTVYFIDTDFSLSPLGTLEAGGADQVSMVDNGTYLVIAQGTKHTWQVKLSDHTLTMITDSNWPTPVSKVDYLDTFTLMNQVGTRQFWSTLSNVLTMDPLYFASKTARTDLLQSLIVLHREIWLIGTKSTEIWYNAGNQQFPFALIPGAFVEYGTPAKYSVCRHGLQTFWLSQDQDGRAVVLAGANYNAQRISTHAVEEAISGYSDITDCIAMVRQQLGHVFIVLTFPTGDATWVYDLSSGLWHEWLWTDSDGVEHRHRANCMTNAYGKIVAGDWENGKLYTVDLDAYLDDEDPILRRRGYPHLVNDGNRASYWAFQADMDYGTIEDPNISPTVMLRWSDDRGHSWSSPMVQSLGRTGEFKTMAQWSRLGMARDRVFELFWSAPAKVAIQGAWIDVEPWGA